jgi:hypothetical protein
MTCYARLPANAGLQAIAAIGSRHLAPSSNSNPFAGGLMRRYAGSIVFILILAVTCLTSAQGAVNRMKREMDKG